MRRAIVFSFLLFFVAHSNALTIDSVITLSDSCVQIEWIPDTNNTNSSWYEQYGSLCSGADSIYTHCDFIAGQHYTGIAYSYGGEDPWTTFREHLLAGYLVGSHQCHYNQYGDPSNKITGTDCSGFLSFVWDYPRVTTSTFYSDSAFVTIPITEVQPGDALVKATSSCGYHAVLIIETDDLTEAVISEATSISFGCRERVVDLTSSAWDCYKAIRYPQIVNAPVKKALQQTGKTFSVSIENKGGKNIFLTIAPSFSGTISGFLSDGTLLFKKNIIQSESSIMLETRSLKSNTMILELKNSTLRQLHKINLINL